MTAEPIPADHYEQGVVEADFDILAGDADEPGDDAQADGEPSAIGHGDAPVPDGYTRDRQTGQLRPKLKPGRPSKSKPAAELAAEPAPEPPPADRPPEPVRHPQRVAAEPEPEAPMPRGGVIAKGVNKLYRRAGRFVKLADHDIGMAVIECTKPDPDDPDWLTVGEAWEALARENPRIRAWALKLIAGGAWGDLFMAHAPIGIAIVMKPAIMRMIPLHRLMSAFSDEDEDGEDTGTFDGLTQEDIAAMARQAGMDTEQMASAAAKLAGRMPPGMAAAAEQAMRQASGQRLTPSYDEHDLSDRDGTLPAGFKRQQPKRTSRAQRAGAR